MRKTCEVCKNKTFQYVCPSCEIVYCSVECYKLHNSSCVKSFLDNQVNENIRNNELTDFDIKEFKFKLKKFYDLQDEADCKNEGVNVDRIINGYESPEKKKGKNNDNDDNGSDDNDDDNGSDDNDDDNGSDDNDNDNGSDDNDDNDGQLENPSGHLKKWYISNKRYKVLTELALKDEIKLENLNEKEKKQFFSFIKNNDMNLYIERYEPWWLNCVIKKMKIPEEHICCIKKVNDQVIYIIIEIIYAYCYLHRIYNKSINNKEFCYSLLYISESLNRFNIPQTNVLNTINNIFEKIIENDELIREKNVLYNVITDVTKILNLKELLLRSLYETKKIFKKEIQKIQLYKEKLYKKNNNPTKILDIMQEEKLFKYVNKKIKFLYSYSYYHFENFQDIHKQLTNFYNEHKRYVIQNEKREITFEKQ
ncbi:conserved Plasmodium protein, unknown function [Plasmodium sp. gorilla clade G2]|uniref:conserved Plasmodium protein, unknown function n=1 Tax=Plasmodium sp. gorilla clade G2 TaxID=880535 RepID=UPI000D21DCCE|nr:conserved Plasmodium protein, unknown function [Plasmodium sp. gorilla clade G2]SOV14124.1 conserved Plasmodium protein, unknown function [Plasmodium sp. gorilla clade G2]